MRMVERLAPQLLGILIQSLPATRQVQTIAGAGLTCQGMQHLHISGGFTPAPMAWEAIWGHSTTNFQSITGFF
jgi:hypothetical protein